MKNIYLYFLIKLLNKLHVTLRFMKAANSIFLLLWCFRLKLFIYVLRLPFSQFDLQSWVLLCILCDSGDYRSRYQNQIYPRPLKDKRSTFTNKMIHRCRRQAPLKIIYSLEIFIHRGAKGSQDIRKPKQVMAAGRSSLRNWTSATVM